LFGNEQDVINSVLKRVPNSSTRKDAKGNAFIDIQDPQSPTGVRSYVVNKPGLDLQDIASGLSQALLFAATGGAAAAATRGVPVLASTVGGRALTQAGAAGATELGVRTTFADGDITEVDPIQVGIAAAAGGAGQLIGEGLAAVGRRLAAPSTPTPTPSTAPAPTPTAEGIEAAAKTVKTEDVPKIVAAADIDPKIIKAARKEGVEEQLLASHASRNPEYVAIEQGLKSIPGSKLATKEQGLITTLANKADDLITTFGGVKDKTALTPEIKELALRTIDDISGVERIAYDDIARVAKGTRVDVDNIKQALNAKAANLGGVDKLDALDRKLLKLTKDDDGPMYDLLDRERKKIGEALRGAQGIFPNQTSGELKQALKLVTEAQEAHLNTLGKGDLWKHAKDLTKQRKRLEDDTVVLLGKEHLDSVMPKVGLAVKKLSQGDTKNFKKLMRAMPQELKEKVLVTSLNDAFTLGSRKETQLAVPGFADWWTGINRNKTARDMLFTELPKGAVKRLKNLGKLTTAVRNAQTQAITTGRVLAVPGLFDNGEGALRRGLKNTLSRGSTLAGAGLGSGLGPEGAIAGAVAGGKVGNYVVGALSKDAKFFDALLENPVFNRAFVSLNVEGPDAALPLFNQLANNQTIRSALKVFGTAGRGAAPVTGQELMDLFTTEPPETSTAFPQETSSTNNQRGSN
jgi:hypothetical protein